MFKFELKLFESSFMNLPVCFITSKDLDHFCTIYLPYTFEKIIYKKILGDILQKSEQSFLFLTDFTLQF